MLHVASSPSPSTTTASLWLLLLLQDMQDMQVESWVGDDWFRAEPFFVAPSPASRPSRHRACRGVLRLLVVGGGLLGNGV